MKEEGFGEPMFPCHMSNERGKVRGTTFPAHTPADVLGAVLMRAASLNGAIRLRVNDALDGGTPLNCAQAVQAGGGGVQFAPLCCAHNVERDALAPFLAVFLLFIDFFYDPHFSVAAPPKGG